MIRTTFTVFGSHVMSVICSCVEMSWDCSWISCFRAEPLNKQWMLSWWIEYEVIIFFVVSLMDVPSWVSW